MEGKQCFSLKCCHSFCRDIYCILSQQKGDIFLLSPCMIPRRKTHNDKRNISFGIESQWASSCSGSCNLFKEPHKQLVLFDGDLGSKGYGLESKDDVSLEDQSMTEFLNPMHATYAQSMLMSRWGYYLLELRRKPEDKERHVCFSFKKCLPHAWVGCFNF